MVKVAVTGGTGYVASWCVHFLLEAKHEVVATVRDPDSAKAKFLHDWKSSGAKLEIKKADLLDGEDVWMPILSGCDYVLHVASPFPLKTPKNEDEVIRPAVSGAEVVVRTAAKAKVKRLVLTSSVVAIYDPVEAKTYTTADWTTAEGASPYTKSKTLAEKAAWAIVESSTENPNKMEMSTINPSFVMGPTPPGYDGKDFASAEFIKMMMEKKIPMLPEIYMGVVDVRDVAQAHIKAMTTPQAASKRFIVSSQVLPMEEMNAILAKRWPEKNLKVGNAPYFLFWIMTLIDAGAAGFFKQWGIKFDFDISDTNSILGMEMRSGEEAIIAMSEKMVESGYVEDPPASSCAVM